MAVILKRVKFMHQEKQLVKKAKKEKQSFLKLYEHYYPKLYAFVLARLKNKERAEDIVQETFLKALKNIAKFKWRGISFGAWLFQVAQNSIVDSYRQDKKIKFCELEEIEKSKTFFESPEETLIFKQDCDEQGQKYQKIMQAMSVLKEEEKTVLMLKYVSSLPYKQISQILNKKPEILAVMLYRAIKKLKRVLNQENGKK